MSTSQRITMGSDGPEISRLSYGVWRLLDDPEGADIQRVLAKIETCLEHGITTFDHADIYGGYACEEAFGRALKAQPALRERIELITKCGIMLHADARPKNRIKHYDYSRAHIVSSVERSLRNLGVERIDVLLLHRPSPLLAPAEVAEAVTALRSAGKLGYLGVSNFTPSQVSVLAAALDAPLVANQIELHPLRLDPFLDGTLDQCLERGITPMAWSPTAGGRLFRADEPVAARVQSVLATLSDTYQASADQLLYAWLLQHPAGIVPVLGTNRLERIASAARSLAITLELQDWFAIWSAATGNEVP